MSNNSDKLFCRDGNQYFISNDQGRSWHNLHGTELHAIADKRDPKNILLLSLDDKNYFPLQSCNNINNKSPNSKNPLLDDINKRKELDKVFDDIRIAVANLGIRLHWDRHIRQIYTNRIGDMRRGYLKKVYLGDMTLDQAYVEASIARNRIMNEVRKITHSIGYFQAKKQKEDGKSVKNLLKNYTLRMYVKENVKIPHYLSSNQKKKFIKEQVEAMKAQLSSEEQLKMYEDLPEHKKTMIKKDILIGSGNPQEVVMEALKNPRIFDAETKKFNAIGTLNAIGKYTLYVSLLVSLYNIITADDKIAATEHELMGYGAGAVGMYAGGFVGGALLTPFGLGIFGAYGGGLIGSFLAIHLMDSYVKL